MKGFVSEVKILFEKKLIQVEYTWIFICIKKEKN